MAKYCHDGYLMLPRDLTEKQLFRLSGDAALVYLYLYTKAHWRRNNGHVVGTLETSYRLAEAELVKAVGFREEPISRNAWHAATELLTKRGLIRTEKTTHGMVVTVCGYERYTDPTSYEADSEADSETDTKADSEADTPSYREEEKKEELSLRGNPGVVAAVPEKKEKAIGKERTWSVWLTAFRESNPACAEVSEMAFYNTIRDGLAQDPSLDVERLIADFGRRWSGVRVSVPIAALEKMLRDLGTAKKDAVKDEPPAAKSQFGFTTKHREIAHGPNAPA